MYMTMKQVFIIFRVVTMTRLYVADDAACIGVSGTVPSGNLCIYCEN